MKNLRFFAIVNVILSILGVFALIFLFLALSDIANGESDTSLEWYIAGTSMIILSVFTVSSIITNFQMFKHLKITREKTDLITTVKQ